jgi:hypothetical protein
MSKMLPTPRVPTVFISYAWEKDVNKWVQGFASRLRADGVDARIDQWETVPGDHLTEYMERSIRDNEFVLIICTPLYKLKADSRSGGVGYEGHIITGEIFSQANHRKFIPVLCKSDWSSSAPSFLKSKFYSDLTDSPGFENNYGRLLGTLNGRLIQPPPIGSPSVPSARPSVGPSSTPSPELNDGESILRALEDGLPEDLVQDEDANGNTVFIDSQGLQRVKVYEYQGHCKVRVRCSRDWGFKECSHRKNHRNANGWLSALRVENETDLKEVLDLYDLEWGNCEP